MEALRRELMQLQGQEIASRYRIDGLLGWGGMGGVFQGWDLDWQEAVAIKVMLPGIESPERLQRFRREARLSARIQHKHVVRLYDAGKWDERFFLVMELVPGCTLQALFHHRLDVGLCCGLLCQVLEALAHVHARSILHRDIKPENIMVSRLSDGALHCRVADFGISAMFGDPHQTRLTQKGSFLGTPAYAAPEQLEDGMLLGPATDLYAVGVLCYRMLTGKLPFDGSLTQMLLHKMTRTPVPPEGRDGVTLPEGLSALTLKLLARHPEERFARAAEVLDALRPYARSPQMSQEAWRRCLMPGLPGAPAGEESLTATAAGLSFELSVELAERSPQAPLVPSDEVLVGREEALQALEATAKDVLDGLHSRVVLLRGEAGIGKTCLAQHLAIRLQERGWFDLMHGSYIAQAGAVEGLRLALDRKWGTVGRDRDVVTKASREFLRQFDPHQELELDDIVGFMRPQPRPGQPEHIRRQHFSTFCRILRCISHSHPLLLWLDDAHFSGEEVAAFLDFLLFEDRLQALPVMVVACLREGSPQAEAAFAHSPHRGRSLESIQLQPLPAELLAEHLQSKYHCSPKEAQHFARRAGGNPLFAALLAQANAEPSTTTSGAEALPPSLLDLLELHLHEQLQQLPHATRARNLLAHLAILGERAPVALLEEFVGEHPDIDEDIDALIERNVLLDAFAGVEQVAFRQALLQEHLLNQLSPRQRRRMHSKAAQLRMSLSPEREPGLIGDHLAAARKSDEAGAWWQKAMHKAGRAGEAMAAVHWGRKALQVLPDGSSEAGECALLLGRILRSVGALHEAQQLLERPQPVDQRLQAIELQAEIAQELGDGKGWSAWVHAIDPLLARAGPQGQQAACRAQAFYYNHQLRYAEAQEAAQRAFSLATTAEERATAAPRLAWALLFLHRHEEAQSIARAALDGLDDSQLELRAEALRTLGRILSFDPRQDLEEAIALTRGSLQLQRRIGRHNRVATVQIDLCYMLCFAGRYDECQRLAHETLSRAQVMGLTLEALRASFLEIWGALHCEARPVYADRLAGMKQRAQEAGFLPMLDLLALSQAQALVREGRLDEALDLCHTHGHFAEFKSLLAHTQLLAELCDVLFQARNHGHPTLRSTTQTLLARCHQRLSKLGHEALAARCQRQLDALSSQR